MNTNRKIYFYIKHKSYQNILVDEIIPRVSKSTTIVYHHIILLSTRLTLLPYVSIALVELSPKRKCKSNSSISTAVTPSLSQSLAILSPVKHNWNGTIQSDDTTIKHYTPLSRNGVYYSVEETINWLDKPIKHVYINMKISMLHTLNYTHVRKSSCYRLYFLFKKTGIIPLVWSNRGRPPILTFIEFDKVVCEHYESDYIHGI